MIIIEHHLDVVKSCDWVVDLARKAANAGRGAKETPEAVAGG